MSSGYYLYFRSSIASGGDVGHILAVMALATWATQAIGLLAFAPSGATAKLAVAALG